MTEMNEYNEQKLIIKRQYSSDMMMKVMKNQNTMYILIQTKLRMLKDVLEYN